jgi:N-acetylneuraminic acid mutarotase
VTLGNSAYLFGGGQLEGSRPDILRITGGGKVSTAGRLPQPASDVGAAVIGNVAYVVGGYTGSRALDTVVAWQPGQAARVVGHLPAPVRYPAVTAANGHVIIVGGTNQAGTATRDVLSFDPTTGHAVRIGSLRRGLTHAAAAVLGGMVYVLGGRGTGTSSQHRSILTIDPRSGTSGAAGVLPRSLSDSGAVGLSDRILLIGGRDSSGTVRAEVLSVQRR